MEVRHPVHASPPWQGKVPPPETSAESANQGCVQVATHRRNIGECGIANNRRRNAQVNRAVSATEFFLQGSWGVAPG